MKYEVIVPDRFEKEFVKFVLKLDKASRAKLSKETNMLEDFGFDLGMPYSKRVDSKLWELRTGGKQKVRVLYCVRSFNIYFLNWFIKKSKKLPKRELDKAHNRLTYI